jgi:hypothetical protein
MSELIVGLLVGFTGGVLFTRWAFMRVMVRTAKERGLALPD